MIKPHRNFIFIKILDFFLNFKFKQSFSSLNFLQLSEINFQKPILIFGNHSTWWDGFIIWQLNRKIFNKNFYVIMLEASLKKLWFFQKIGAFSINPGQKSVVNSIHTASNLLKNEDTLLLFFPQGKLHSIYENSFDFSTGIDKIIQKSHDIELVAYASFLDFAANEKPYFNIYFKSFESHIDLESQYHDFYNNCKIKHISTFKP